MRTLFLALILMAAARAATPAASGVIFLESDDPAYHSSTPGDNSGWQYEGQFNAFLGTPIAPLYFITAKHIGGAVGQTFTFHGEAFTTTAVFPDDDSDLQIWQVDHPFATYAPLYTQTNTEAGRELHVFGRGTQRGDAMYLDGALHGWAWGTVDLVPRWGRNAVASIVPNGDGGFLLQASFDSPGLPGEAHLSAYDSGGGNFILQDGLWRLAGVNYAVDDLYTAPDPGTGFAAAIFDARGYYVRIAEDAFEQVTGSSNVPTSFYCTQISSRLEWISGITGVDSGILPAESFGNWQHAYFTPDQLADGTVSGPGADSDGDGVANLLEFAFNLDPTYAEPAVMTADTGLRGLPLIRLEPVADSSGQSLTVEFVRRTAASGAGVAYAVQFTSSLDPALADWQTGGTESVTPINARWERVKVTDPVASGGTLPRRFARVAVTQDSPDRAASVKRQRAHRR